MGYFAINPKWFVAELIEEITISADPRNVVHRNFVPVRADSAEEAYKKAIEIGKSHEISSVNFEGKQVSTRFHGLGNLNIVQDELEDVAELFSYERLGVPEEEIRTWVLTKEQLIARH